MVPNIDRGRSFKGVTAYLTHDKREGGEDVETADRVGFTTLYNFIGDEARTPAEAAKVMALTARDADALKTAAGVRPGGRKAEKPPVWHASLAWHPTETPDEAEMHRAIEQALNAVGLSLDAGYQTYAVQHTDEPHPHVHIVVNLVHPITGKQTNPYRDLPKAQAWGNGYDKARGQVFCHDRAAKYDGRDAANENRAAFNRAAENNPAPKTQQTAGSATSSRSRREYQARKGGQGADGRETAEALRKTISAKYASQAKLRSEAYEARRADTARFHQDRRDGRDAIYLKFKHAIDAVYAKAVDPPPDPVERQRAAALFDQMQMREAQFRRNEGTLLGRLANSTMLAPQSALKSAALAFKPAERQRLFDRSQDALRRASAPKPAPARAPNSQKTLSKKERAGHVRDMRKAELTAYDRDTARQAAALKDRQSVAIANEKAMRTALAKESADAWHQHAAKYGTPAPDRFGRSRDRSGRAGAGEGGSDAAAARRAAFVQAKARAAAEPPEDRGRDPGKDYDR